MYTQLDFLDAKAKLSVLLREVEHGQHFTITLRGRPIADLVPTESVAQERRAAVAAMRCIHKVRGISNETLVELVTEGRR